MKSFNFVILFLLLSLFSCKLNKPVSGAYGGNFEPDQITKKDAKILTGFSDLAPVLVRHNCAERYALNNKIPGTKEYYEEKLLYKKPFAFAKKQTISAHQIPDDQNKHVIQGGRFALAGAFLAAIGLVAGLSINVAWIASAFAVLFALGIGLFLYGVIRGFVGYRQMKKYSENPRGLPRVMQVLFWLTAALLILGAIAGMIIPVLYYK